MKRVLFTAAAVLALGVPALAQHEHHTAPADAGGLPATCLENANAMAAVPAGHDMGGDEAHKALMAGMDKMNPGSVILSGVMMLEYLGWNEAAQLIETALGKTILQKTVTYDLARGMEGATELKTSQFGAAIIANM